MRIAIGADHAGFEMKRDLAGYLAQCGHEVTDLGTHSTAPVDYPDMAEAVAQAIRNGQADRGVLVCGSGAGAAVAACKFPGVRAAVCHDAYTARQAVEHDDLNILCLGARVIGPALARTLADAFLAASFSGEERHMARLAKIDAIETRYSRDE
ncbi:MAG: ribose 5-phosphate isomerase B [Acidobacteria bacterium RIFCSPLOWO2_12_FULL_67_14b]|nr:MAG: ribose 5-phosphate isomerase B [Acidobacteria bacterium RIFCSPLOWO2_12_FULL_67_14b]